MPSKTPKPYCSVLLTRWTCASFQSTIVPSIQILSAFSIRLPDHLLAASRSTIVWPPIATYAVNIDCPRPAGCTAWWAREDSNLQPDRYERSAYPGRSRKIRYLGERSTTFVHVWCTHFIGQTL